MSSTSENIMPVKVSTTTGESPVLAEALAATMATIGPPRRAALRAKLRMLHKELAAPNVEVLCSDPLSVAVPVPPSEAFPATRLLNPSHDSERDLRLARENEVRSKERQLAALQGELSKLRVMDYDTLNGIQHYSSQLEVLKVALKDDFVPKHAQFQLISPRSFFVDRLFHVRSRYVERAAHLEFPLEAGAPDAPRYVGPELRQSDGLVFMALLNLCRDYRVGKTACFNVASMTTALWDSYNGQMRQRLKQTIQRLQRATIEFPGFTVQLVQRFEHPQRGEWAVALDKDIVQLFSLQPEVWLELPVRRRLPEGLSTWLYGYVRSQSRLIPWRIDDLRARCGSEANDKTFREMLGKALKALAMEGIIDSGWSLKGNRVHWRKLSQPAALQRASRPSASDAPAQGSLLSADESGGAAHS